MAHIRRHPNKQDTWQVRYIDPTGRERSKGGFKRKIRAEKYAHQVEAQKQRGEWINPDRAAELNMGDDRLGSRASTTSLPSSHVPKAQAKSATSSGVSPPPTTPRIEELAIFSCFNKVSLRFCFLTRRK